MHIDSNNLPGGNNTPDHVNALPFTRTVPRQNKLLHYKDGLIYSVFLKGNSSRTVFQRKPKIRRVLIASNEIRNYAF